MCERIRAADQPRFPNSGVRACPYSPGRPVFRPAVVLRDVRRCLASDAEARPVRPASNGADMASASRDVATGSARPKIRPTAGRSLRVTRPSVRSTGLPVRVLSAARANITTEVITVHAILVRLSVCLADACCDRVRIWRSHAVADRGAGRRESPRHPGRALQRCALNWSARHRSVLRRAPAGHELSPVRALRFGQDAADVGLDGALGEHQPGGDLLVG